jgi:O-antigen/teichoic acid export membrane protein
LGSAPDPPVPFRRARAWLPAALASLTSLVSLARRAHLLPFTVSMAVVQGAPSVAQVVAARLLGPAEFGTVRVVEALLALLLIPAGIGMSSAVVRYTAVAGDEPARRGVLRRCLQVTVLGGLATLVAALVAAPFLPITSAAADYLRAMAVSILFANVSRTVLNHLQGRKQFQAAARWSVATATAGLLAVVTGTALHGLHGWAVGRVLGEAVAVPILLALAWRRDAGPTGAAPPGLVRFGVFAAGSLTLDRIVSTSDTLVLDGLLRDASLVGQYGVASLVVGTVSLLPAAVVAILVPRLAERSRRPDEAMALATGVLPAFLGMVTAGAVGVATLAPFLIPMVVGRGYTLGGELVVALAPVVVLTALLSFGGALLMAFDRADLALVQSGLGALLSLLLSFTLIPRFGAFGAAAATVAAQAARLLVMALLVRSVIPGRGRG